MAHTPVGHDKLLSNWRQLNLALDRALRAAAHGAREPDQRGADQSGDDAGIGPGGLEIHHGAVRIGKKAGALADPVQSQEKDQKADYRKRNSHDFPPAPDPKGV